MKLRILSCLVAGFLLTGCATLFTSHHATLKIDSNPPGATIKDAEGLTSTTAPYEFKPEKGKSYAFTVSKEGYEDYRLEIKPVKDNLALFGDAMLLCIPCIVDLPSKAYLYYQKKSYTADLHRLRPVNSERDNRNMLASSSAYINILQPEVKMKDRELLGKINSSNSKYDSDKPFMLIGTAEGRAEDVCGEFKNYKIEPLQCGINKYTPDESMHRIVPEKQLNLKISIDQFHFTLRHKSNFYTGSGEMESTWQLMDPNQNLQVVKERKISTSVEFHGRQVRYLFSDLLKKSAGEFIVTDELYDFITSKKLTSAELLKGEEITLEKIITPKFEKTKDLISHCIKGVVTIKTNKGFGSGVVVSTDGFIITNEHVLEENNEVNVKFNNGFSLKGKVIKRNIAADLALIKVEAADLTPLKMFTEEAEIGEDVFAIGTPGDISLEQTVSKGIISGRRNIDGLKYLQTDVSINPGNSGGPLINDNGQILGITSMKIVAKGFEGLGFAIPSGDVMKMLNLTIR